LRKKVRSPRELAARLPHHQAKEVRHACREVDALREQGYLNPGMLKRSSPYREQELLACLARGMSGMTVFLTTRCNLACSYCMYGSSYPQSRVPFGITMTWETAANALSFLHRHSEEADRIKLLFFGGEPLLAFSLMRRCMDYWREISGSKANRTDLVLITNGTLLRGDRLDYLIRNRVHIQISLDGDAATHDMGRPYRKSGRGSFEDIYANLAAIHSRDPEYLLRYVQLKSVVTSENAARDDSFFYRHPVIAALAQAGNLHHIEERPHRDPAHDAASTLPVRELGRKLLRVRGARTISDLLSTLHDKERLVFNWTYADFYKVQTVNKACYRDSAEVPFLRSCLMGYQDSAVLPNGDIAVCAEATSHIIGNVNEGRWHYDRIAEMHSRLYQDWAACSECFVERFCRLCWQKVTGGGDVWRSGRTRFCRCNREHYRMIFDVMLRVLARNPDLWNDLARAVREGIAKIRAELISSSSRSH
jgi:uncharacterized protein